MKEPNFKLEMKGDRKAVIEIYDEIGPSWAGMIDATTVSKAINEAGPLDTIEVRINSPGGSVFQGIAIYNILRGHAAKKHVKVDGVAASSASVIAMAGDTIEVPKNAFVMIHDPAIVARGGESDMRKAAEMLVKVKAVIVDTYAKRTGKEPEAIAKMMSEETWMDGDAALEAGFASQVGAEISLTNAASVTASFGDYPYTKTPENASSLWSLAMTSARKEPIKMADSKTPEVLAAEQAAAAATAKIEADAKALADKQAAEAKSAADLANERKRAADITAACGVAKKSELAAKFIEDGASLSDVNAALLKAVCAANAPNDDGNQDGLDMSKDEDAGYKAEFAAAKAVYAREGISEADYVAMRRVDDGKDQLKTKAA